MIKARSWSGDISLVAAVAALAVIVIADILVGSSVVLIPMLVACPLIAASGGPPSQPVIVGAVATVSAAGLGWPDDIAGTARHVILTATVAVGSLLAWRIAVARDEREQLLISQQPTLERAARLARSLQSGQVGEWWWDIASGSIGGDREAARLFGLDGDVMNSRQEDWLARIDERDRGIAIEAVRRGIADRSGFRFDVRVQWADGSMHWIEGMGEIVVTEHDEPTGAAGLVLDVDERYRFLDERSRLLTLEHRGRVRAEYLARIHDVLGRSIDIEEIARTVADAAVPDLCDWCSVLLSVDRPRRTPLIVAAHRDPAMVSWADDLQQRYPYDPDAPFGAAKVIRTGERDVATGVAAHLDSLPPEVRDVFATADVDHVLTVPIIGPLGVLGAVQLIRGSTREPFSPDDLDLIDELASRSGAALNTAVLLARQVSTAESLETLQRVSGWLARAATVQEVATAVVMHGAAGMHARGAFVFSSDDAELQLLESTGLTEADHATWVRELAQRTVDADAVLREQVTDPASDQMREVLLTPLRLFDRVVGVLGYAFNEGESVTTEQLAVVASSASRCAGAFERARLYERERNAALLLQHRLLPQLPPIPDWLEVAARYEPAIGGQVGGDWFQLLELADGRFAASVGDAVGHGITSAAAMGQLRASLSTAVSVDPDPGGALSVVDRFADQGLGTLAATAALAVVDHAGSVRLASAGHPPPLLVRSSGVVEVVDGGRRPVLGFGLGGDRDAAAVEFEFGEGDMLLMFSDGLIERRGEVIDTGLDLLSDIVCELRGLPAQALCDQIVMRMRGFTGTDDDVVLLIVRLVSRESTVV